MPVFHTPPRASITRVMGVIFEKLYSASIGCSIVALATADSTRLVIQDVLTHKRDVYYRSDRKSRLRMTPRVYYVLFVLDSD